MSMVAPPRPSRDNRSDRVRTDRARTDGDPSGKRHLRVVDAPRHRGRRRLWMSLAFVGIFVVLFGTVTFHVHLVTGQQHIDELNRSADAAQERYDRLRVEVDRLSAPDRVVAKARGLGMVQADDPTWLPSPPSATSDGESATSPVLRDYLDVRPYLRDTP